MARRNQASGTGQRHHRSTRIRLTDKQLIACTHANPRISVAQVSRDQSAANRGRCDSARLSCLAAGCALRRARFARARTADCWCSPGRRSGCLRTTGDPLKVGLGPLICDLIREGVFNALSTNGAAMIYDFELALAGRTSEEGGRRSG